MRNIERKVDLSLCEALSCAEHRFPRICRTKNEAGELSLALRYALIGLAADYYILSLCDFDERPVMLRQLRSFGTMIREHVDVDMVRNPAHQLSANQGATAQHVYDHLFDRNCELMTVGCPFDLALSVLVEEFVSSHEKVVRPKLFGLAGRSLQRAFEQEAQNSLRFALCFYERRKYDIEEVPEIALLDE